MQDSGHDNDGLLLFHHFFLNFGNFITCINNDKTDVRQPSDVNVSEYWNNSMIKSRNESSKCAALFSSKINFPIFKRSKPTIGKTSMSGVKIFLLSGTNILYSPFIRLDLFENSLKISGDLDLFINGRHSLNFFFKRWNQSSSFIWKWK